MTDIPGKSFHWFITPGLEVEATRLGDHIRPVLIWRPTCPPRKDDPAPRIVLRLNQLQIAHPKAPSLALLAKAVSEIHPYAKAAPDRRGPPLNNPRRMV